MTKREWRAKYNDVLRQGGHPTVDRIIPVRKYTVKAHFRVHPKRAYKDKALQDTVLSVIVAFLSMPRAHLRRRAS